MITPSIQFTRNIKPKIYDWEFESLVHNEITIVNDFFRKEGINKYFNPLKRIALHYDKTLQMNNRYIGENIHYADYRERFCNFQIFTYEGKLYDKNGDPINTGRLNFDNGAILVMDSRGNLFLANKIRGEIHHSTFFLGASVAYACMLEVDNGVIIREEAWSGHYLPDTLAQAQFHDRLNKDFTETFDKDLKVIFLTALQGEYYSFSNQDICRLTCKTIIDPVQLPCGTIFERPKYEEWYQKTKASPFNAQEIFPFSSLISGAEKTSNRISGTNSYTKHFETVKATNEILDEKVKSLNLDDWISRPLEISTTMKRKGVLLFLKPDCTLQRIAQIAKDIGLLSFNENPPSFKINGFTITDLNVSVSDPRIDKEDGYNTSLLIMS